MNTNKGKDIKAEELIGLRGYLKNCLSKLDCRNIKHRQIVIEAIEEYIKRYVTPALYLLPNTDINKAVGAEITGLGLGVLFDSKREGLNRPSDEEIDEVFKELTELEPTPERRMRFWDAWLVRNALNCVTTLCNFLKEPILSGKKQLPVSVLNQEIKQLQYILTLPMTPAFEQWIDGVLKWEKEALAEWNEEATTS